MQKILLSLMLLGGTVLCAQSKKHITLEDLFAKGTFQLKSVPGFNAMADGKHYTTLEADGGSQKVRKYELASGKEVAILFDGAKTLHNQAALPIQSYELSGDESKILFFTKGKQIFRHSFAYDTYLYDIKSKKLQAIGTEKVMHATLSPDAKKLAYVSDNNLFVYDVATAKSLQITFDGKRNEIINGNCDWVYEEEFGFTKAFQWSPDGSYLAYYKFDESKVPMYTMTMYDSLYPRPYTFKYPKAGDDNSVVSIYAYHLSTAQTKTLHQGSTKQDEYVPRIKWGATGNKLCIYLLNRHQNHLQLKMINADALFRGMYASGIEQIIYSEKNKYYINITDNLTFLKDGRTLIFDSEQSGYNQLYRYDMVSKKLKRLTSGNFDIEQIIGVDEATQKVYYTAALPNPNERQLYSISYITGNETLLTREPGTHRITAIEGHKYFLDAYSALGKVPLYYLRDNKGTIIRVLENNEKAKEVISQYDLGQIKLTKVKGVKEWLNAWMITPPNFDSSKSYPLLMFQYSGPQSQQVADRFPTADFFWHQMLAQKGYVVLCADGTGTGFRGQEFAKKTYLQLGKLESDDQIAVAKYMASKSWIDKQRIGIWGWSYGGFMSATCLLKGNDVFKMAIAVAPVTNWRYYDNIYTERYMRTPAENKDGYDLNAPELMADQLKGKLLLIHGTGDDNVHFQNAAMLVKNLVAANKQFDSEFYTDKAHGISGGKTRMQLYTRMTQFILDHL